MAPGARATLTESSCSGLGLGKTATRRPAPPYSRGMRTLILSTLLLAAPASTQTAPAGVSTTLKLAAPVGASAELCSNVTLRITMEDVQGTGPDGKRLSAADLSAIRTDLQEEFRDISGRTFTGKVTYRVQARGADGTVTLLTGVTTSLPDSGPFSFRLTQTVAPNGKTTVVGVESDDPQMQAVMRNLPPLALQTRFNGDDPLNLYGLYGRTFTVGQAQTQNVSIEAQELLGAFAGANAGSVQAKPLNFRTTTTYRGTNAAGQRVFDVSGTADQWKVDLTGGSAGQLKMEVLSGKQSGQNVYRADGLPASQTKNQTLWIRLSVTPPDGSRVQVVMRLDQINSPR